MKKIAILLLILCVTIPVFASKSKQVERLQESAIVIQEIMNVPEQGIPIDLLKKAECIIIIPSMKKAALESVGTMAAVHWLAERQATIGAHP